MKEGKAGKQMESKKLLNLNNVEYELTAVRMDQYPKNDMPEVAFVGRSNVGKSSLINTLLNRKNLARIGSTPGKTRKINFYNIDNKLYFVDLPGYGYANVSKNEKAAWGKMIETYLNSRKCLKLIIMLTDIRHTPTSDDVIMFHWIQSFKLSHLIIATKSDKISKGKLGNQIMNIQKTLHCTDETIVIPFSAVTKQGRKETWEHIDMKLQL